MSLPGVIPQGITNQNLLSHYDVFPTLLDYLRIPFGSNAKLPGRSFASLLRGEKLIENDFIVVYDEYGPVRMIRTKEWKYVHRYPYGPHEFYNLYQDPEERHNIIDQLNIQPKLREMRNELETWFLKYSHPDLDGTRLAVYGKGQNTYVGKRSSGEIPFSEDWYYVDVDGNRLKKE
jgi:arylsulfatase A-like enzyme